jgi:hypothetical protein
VVEESAAGKENKVVRVLVGKKKGQEFPGFWAEFEGEEVSSYTDARGEKQIVYTLYRCTAYSDEVYRAHITDESNPANPVYELLPHDDERSGYDEPWEKEDIAAKYPLFLKDMDYFDTRRVDPEPGVRSRQL